MAHDLLIVLHTVAGVVCFAAGVLSMGLLTGGSWRFRVYLVSLVSMLVFLAGAIVLDWQALDSGTRIVFVALVGLGLYMMWRAADAGARLRRHGRDWRPRYLDDVGFTLIALFDGFVIIAALDLGAPAWLVVLIAVAGVVGGHLSVRRVKVRLGAAPAG